MGKILGIDFFGNIIQIFEFEFAQICSPFQEIYVSAVMATTIRIVLWRATYLAEATQVNYVVVLL